ncbi:hypothetical protein COY28_04330, partial [Candidatus Woesearchaeota archaeon CG_4_10_14_0_2_um_filter_57_5]
MRLVSETENFIYHNASHIQRLATMGEENLKEQLAVLQAKLAVLEKQLLQGQQDVIRETVKEVLSQTQ